MQRLSAAQALTTFFRAASDSQLMLGPNG